MTFSSLSATLSTALTGLNVAQANINSTAHNIVNANTEGYTRKTQSQESRTIDGRGVGVDIGIVQRSTDEFLTREVRVQAAITGRSTTLETYHSRLQDAFGNPSSGHDIGTRLGELQATLDAFSNDHQTFALDQNVVGGVSDVARALSGLSDQVQNIRREANQEIDRLVDDINADIKAIDDLNNEIARVDHIGEENPDLLDKRDLIVQELAEKIQLETYPQDHGKIALYTANGETLLDSQPRVLYYTAPGNIAPDITLPALSIFTQSEIDTTTGSPIDPTGGRELISSGVRAILTPELQNDAIPDADQIITSSLTSGRLQGLVEFRDKVLPELNDQLQELAAGLSFTLNAAHNEGVAWPQPNALSGSRTDLSDFAAAPRSGTATLAVTDANDGSTLLAFQIDIGAATDETDLVNQINTNLGAFGTAAIGADGQLEITLSNADQGLAIAEGDSSIQLTDAAGRTRDFGFSHYFGLNDLLVQDGILSSDLTVRPDIVANPVKLTTAMLDVETPPLVATLGGPGDNRAARALTEALGADQTIIARGQLPDRITSLASYAGEIVATTAANAKRAEDQAVIDLALQQSVDFKSQSLTSVNLDEELSSLITMQQAYSVTARLISVTGEMLEELTQALR